MCTKSANTSDTQEKKVLMSSYILNSETNPNLTTTRRRRRNETCTTTALYIIVSYSSTIKTMCCWFRTRTEEFFIIIWSILRFTKSLLQHDFTSARYHPLLGSYWSQRDVWSFSMVFYSSINGLKKIFKSKQYFQRLARSNKETL